MNLVVVTNHDCVDGLATSGRICQADGETQIVAIVRYALSEKEWLKPMIRQYAKSKALVIAWDKAPWHTSKKMRRYVRRWNHYAKRTGQVRILLHYFPTQAPWLNPSEAVIGMILRYGLKNRTHATTVDVCQSIDQYLHWRNSRC